MEYLQEYADKAEFPIDLEYMFLLIPPLLILLFIWCGLVEVIDWRQIDFYALFSALFTGRKFWCMGLDTFQ